MRIWLAPVAAALITSTATPALASDHDPNSGAPLPPKTKHQTPSPITDRFYVRGTFYPVHVKTLLQINPHNAPPGVVGTSLSAERDLGQTSRLNQGRMEMMFRFRKRNKIRIDWLEVDRTATHTLARTIDFGNQTFTAASLLQSEIDWRIFGVTYTYEQAESQAQVSATMQRQDVSGAGAFPTVPIDFAFRISRRWALTWRGQYFHASLNNFDGWLADIHEDVQYRWKDNFALGVGYSSIRAKLALNTGNFPGQFHMNLEGPEIFFRVSF